MLSLSDENMTVDIFNKMDVESAGEIMACMSASKAASLQSGMSKNSGEQAASVLEIVRALKSIPGPVNILPVVWL